MSDKPLYVDLDGTLIRTDLLWESSLRLLFAQPTALLRMPGWLGEGKAKLKREIADRVTLNAATLPYHEGVLAYARAQSLAGRRVILATASDAKYGQAVAAHLGLFDAVLASDGQRNLSGAKKLQAIEANCDGEFVYAGNDDVDIPIWERATRAITVSAPAQAVAALRGAGKLEADFPQTGSRLKPVLKALRPHQWLKNLLVFLPLLPIAGSVSVSAVVACLLAFVAFSMCASAVYIVNDLSDLDADRQHPRKRERPFASGVVPIAWGVMLVPLLLTGAFVVALAVSPLFIAALGAYLVTTTAYTFVLKRYAMVDVVALAGLYTLRVLGGSAAIGIAPSFWILAFSMFIFLSLALAKRCAELDAMRRVSRTAAVGRGYAVGDLSIVQQMGVSAGYLSALVMALYLNTDEIMLRYRHPELLWGVCPLILLWVSRIWLKAGRAEMHDDPLVFALRDRFSRWVLVMAAALVLLALLT